MTIDWKTPLVAINGDHSQAAIQIGNKVLAIGGVYDTVNGIESADHAAWRVDMATQLAALDKAAASVDGLPLTTIDPADPAASELEIRKRMSAAYRLASIVVRQFLVIMVSAQLPGEPSAFANNNYPIPHGDFTGALNAALDQLAAYVAIR